MIKLSMGIVTGYEIKPNKDGNLDKILLLVKILTDNDIQTVEYMRDIGDQTIPVNGTRVLIIGIGKTWKIAIRSDDGIPPTMSVGEKKIYSVANNDVSAFVNFRNDGTVEINGSANYAVRYQALQDAFDQLKTDFDAHVHSGVTTGPGLSGTPTTSITTDISDARVDEVKLP